MDGTTSYTICSNGFNCSQAFDIPPSSCIDLHCCFPKDFYYNKLAAIVASVFLGLTGGFYVWNMSCLLWLFFSEKFCANPIQPQPKRHRHDFAISPLSAILASVIGFVLIFATWPQPFEAAAMLVVVLAQASVLDWQDHDSDSYWKYFFEKAPDVAAVCVGVGAFYALEEFDVDKPWFSDHNPKHEVIIAYTLAGVGSLIGILQELLINSPTAWWLFKKVFITAPAHKERSTPSNASKDRIRKFLYHASRWVGSILLTLNLAVLISSFLFCALQITMAGITIKFGSTTIPDGCKIFTAPKYLDIIVLGIGLPYSASILIVRPYRYD